MNLLNNSGAPNADSTVEQNEEKKFASRRFMWKHQGPDSEQESNLCYSRLL